MIQPGPFGRVFLWFDGRTLTCETNGLLPRRQIRRSRLIWHNWISETWVCLPRRFMRLFLAVVAICLIGSSPFALPGQVASGTRGELSLDGTWELRQIDSDIWQPVTVPGTFESQINVSFDGTAEYRRTVEPIDLKPGRRLLLHFDAVATLADVWFNDIPVGSHLGGWTPFRVDVTEAAAARTSAPWEIRVRVEERVGHNSQGFLPVIAPHFGGIWQSVRLIEVPGVWIDELAVRSLAAHDSQVCHVDFVCRTAGSPVDVDDVKLAARRVGDPTWVTLNSPEWEQTGAADQSRALTARGQIPDQLKSGSVRPWTPEDPARYELRLSIVSNDTFDTVIVPTAFRTLTARGDRFLLNDRPLTIRGLLNWGYAPPGTAPSIDESFMRREIEFAKARGFNLMKFCLWVPPRRYLQLCDELGMLAWIEYPAWHPDFSIERLPELTREYDEFFAHDRNHPSVILRSLTCETGPAADLAVIQALYDRCKDQIPAAIVVDDSSWIEWNRVFDFYDDHPYGNNHTWVAELRQLKRYINQRDIKPLVLGEAMTADTWTEPETLVTNSETGPLWFYPGFLQSSRQWTEVAKTVYGSAAVEHLLEDSKTYAMLMRKYQVETFRREIPHGGYVVSVIRDMPLAAMGLLNYQGSPKWTPEDWAWHGEKMLLLKTAGDHRAFRSGADVTCAVVAADIDFHDLLTGSLNVSLAIDQAPPIDVRVAGGGAVGDGAGEWQVHFTLPEVKTPTRCVMAASFQDEASQTVAANQWPLWIVPNVRPAAKPVLVHPSAIAWTPLLTELGIATGTTKRESGMVPGSPPLILSQVIDAEILDCLARGATAVVLPDNRTGSFPLQSHWFLRGGPVMTDRFHALDDGGWLGPREWIVELQHFDLAADVIPNVRYLDSIDPLVMLWESHDLSEVRTHGLVFRMPVGTHGQLLVSALNHGGPGNVAGHYLLGQLLKPPAFSTTETADELRGRRNLARLQAEVTARRISLEARDWRFLPDGLAEGAAALWYAVDLDDSGWETIQANRHWESQGYPELDGWAWYRIQVAVPTDWPEDPTWLNFSGVDDCYDVYINGQHAGSGGNLERRETAFDLKTSHDISRFVKPGQNLTIAVAVYDWYGAGGIFRPVELSNRKFDDQPQMLK